MKRGNIIKILLAVISLSLFLWFYTRKDNNGYIPELGYCEGITFNIQNYVCWNGMLILEDNIYYIEDGVYKKSAESIGELFGLPTENTVYKIKQCEQYIVMLDKAGGKFLIYDMDSQKILRYSAYCGSAISNIWYVYNGKIYYIANGTLVSLDLLTGDNKKLYSLSDEEMSNDCTLLNAFSIRGDDSVIVTVYHIDNGTSEFRRIEFDVNQQVSEVTIGEVSGYEYVYTLQYNGYGLFLLGEPYDKKEESEILCFKDNGDIEYIDISSLYGLLISDEGYFLCNNAEEIVKDRKSLELIKSLAFYDFHGNLLGQCSLPDTDRLGKEYTIKGIIYHDNKITALYVQEDTDELYISQAQVDLERD